MGWTLRVDLSRNKILKVPLDPSLVKTYIGNQGIAGKILYDEVPPWVEPFDPNNRLIFSTGPVTGTMTTTAGRHSIVTKSPLTGYFGDASSGGFWGAELKFSGYDMIVFQGRAPKPVYLRIIDGNAELKDAKSYWGKDARETDHALRNDLSDKNVKVAAIGPAGENMVRIAGVANDNAERIAARCGVGAVMGFMNLKAVAVRGHAKVPVADMDTLKKVVSEVTQRGKTDQALQDFHKGGTSGSFDSSWQLGDVPAYNWSRIDFGGPGDPGVEKIGREGQKLIMIGTRTCYVCPVACRRVAYVESGPFATEKGVEGPEYETLGSIGSNCGIDNIYAVAKLNDLCNMYGIDTISLGGTLSLAMECYERGMITKEDTDGIELKFGNDMAAMAMLDKIAHREGFGNILAEGSRRAGMIIGNGAERLSIQVKGLEMSVHDPRAAQSMGVHYACTVTGARHTEGFTLGLELGGWKKSQLPYPQIVDRFSTENKGHLAIVEENWRGFINTSGWCVFAMKYGAYGGESNLVKAYSAVTGISMDLAGALNVGERVFNLKKAFNMRHGCTREEDTLPERLTKEKNKSGAVVKLDEMLPQYYTVRGWDPTSGKPTKEKLSQLQLDFVVKDLWPENGVAQKPALNN